MSIIVGPTKEKISIIYNRFQPIKKFRMLLDKKTNSEKDSQRIQYYHDIKKTRHESNFRFLIYQLTTMLKYYLKNNNHMSKLHDHQCMIMIMIPSSPWIGMLVFNGETRNFYRGELLFLMAINVNEVKRL